MTALLVLSVLIAALALPFLSQATQGVGLLTLALFLAVLARIAQAKRQHKEAMEHWANLGPLRRLTRDANTLLRKVHGLPVDTDPAKWPDLSNPE